MWRELNTKSSSTMKEFPKATELLFIIIIMYLNY